MGSAASSSLDGGAVLVTGGLGGIGRAVAQVLATQDARVYLARPPGSALDPANDFITGALFSVDGGQVVN